MQIVKSIISGVRRFLEVIAGILIVPVVLVLVALMSIVLMLTSITFA